MGYRNILISAMDDAVNHATAARDMVHDEQFKKGFDPSDFVLRCSQAVSDLGTAIGTLAGAVDPAALKPVSEGRETRHLEARLAVAVDALSKIERAEILTSSPPPTVTAGVKLVAHDALVVLGEREEQLTPHLLRVMTKGDPLGMGRDPEMMITSVAAAFEHYRRATKDPDTTMRFTEAREEWLKVLRSFAGWEHFSPMARYCYITEWLLKTRLTGRLFDDDEGDIAEVLDDLWKQLYEPEITAVECYNEALKAKYKESP